MTGNILIVDDNAAVRELMAELLRVQGFSVVTAADGRQALEEFARRKPDLVLLDVVMPGLDGFEVCQQLKRDPDNRLVPVVLVTGLTATQDRVRGIEAGADDFLSKPVDRTELFARVRSLLSLKAYTDELERAEAVLFALARSIEGKDPYTEGHCERLGSASAQLGELLQLSAEQIVALRRAGTVHDIGKVAVPDAILLKPGPLSPPEWDVMKQHPAIGERICAPLKSFRLVLPIIRHHHERFDGSGYPDGLKGHAIPLTARVLQLVDVFDALTTERPYKQALSKEESLATMEAEVKKGWWDPAMFSEFRQMLTDGRRSLAVESAPPETGGEVTKR
ncbi:MAG: HD-GYP domain-containing protein [Candidatus Acidiferrales bacterium]